MKNSSLLSAIDIATLKKFKHEVLYRNNTSGTENLDSKLCDIVEMQAKGLVLYMPINSCIVGHNITFYLFAKPAASPITHLPQTGSIKGAVELIGKVISIEEFSQLKKFVVEIQFTQYDAAQWKKVIQKYAEHQDQICSLYQKGSN